MSPLRLLSRIGIAMAYGIIAQEPLGRLGCPALQRITHNCARPSKRGRTSLELLGVHGRRLTLTLPFPVSNWCRHGRRCHLDILRGWKIYFSFGCSFWRG